MAAHGPERLQSVGVECPNRLIVSFSLNSFQGSFSLEGEEKGQPTDISRRAAGGGHDITAPLHLGQAEVTDHDLGLVLGVEVQQVLRLVRQEKKGEMTSLFLCFAGEAEI